MNNFNKITILIIELILTVIIGTWILYRLACDAMSYVDPGWHTTISGQGFTKLKAIAWLIVCVAILYRILSIIYQISKSRNP